MLPELQDYLDILQTRTDQIKDTLNEIGPQPEVLNWRPEGVEGQSSIFGLSAFAALNIDYWIGHLVGGRAEPPGFDDVLDEAAGNDPLVLLQLLNSAVATASLIFEDLTTEQLANQIQYADELYSTRWCILQAIAELAARAGEIDAVYRLSVVSSQ